MDPLGLQMVGHGRLRDPHPFAPPPVVCIVSNSTSAQEWIRRQVENGLPSEFQPKKLQFMGWIAAESTRDPQSMVNDVNTSAVVLVLERDGLADDGYVAALRAAMRQVTLRREFRLYVILKDMTAEEFDEKAQSGNDVVLAELKDTVQITEPAHAARLGQHLREFLLKVDDVRDQATWNRWRLRFASALSTLATFTQGICLVLSVVVMFWATSTSPEVPSWLKEHRHLVSLVITITAFPLCLLGVWVCTRYSAAFLRIHKEDRRGLVWLGLFLLVFPLFTIEEILDVPLEAICQGLAFGVVIDFVRREGRLARRNLTAVDPNSVHRTALSPALFEMAGPHFPSPLSCPIVPDRIPSVFISYTRASPWAIGFARELHQELKEIGHKPFFDERTLPEGSSWRNELNENLGQATVLVLLIDFRSVSREWVAAEVEAALRGQSLTGLPTIFVITSPDWDNTSPPPDSWLPVFRAILDHHRKSARGVAPLVRSARSLTPKALAEDLSPPAYFSLGVLPPVVGEWLYVLWDLSVPVALLIAILAQTVGPFALALGLLEWMIADFSSRLFLDEYGIFQPAYLVVAFVIGLLIRMSIAGRFEANGYRTWIRGYLSWALGFIVLFAAWSAGTELRLVGWAVLSGLFGWQHGSRYALEHHSWRQELLEAEPEARKEVDNRANVR